MKLFTMYKSILIGFAGLFLLSGSETKETPSVVVEVPEADRTVLVYMVGENSLSKFCSRNIDSIASGLQNVAVPVNMLVFEDSYSNTGTLWKIGKEDGVVVKDIVKEYGSVNSVDIDQMASIINDI